VVRSQRDPTATFLWDRERPEFRIRARLGSEDCHYSQFAQPNLRRLCIEWIGRIDYKVSRYD
jgi:hypothetical protein